MASEATCLNGCPVDGVWVRRHPRGMATKVGSGWAAVALLAACGGSDFTPQAAAPVCSPGQQIECACPGATKGVQVCRDDGSGYEACVCAGDSPDAGGGTGDASGSTGTGGAADARPSCEGTCDAPTFDGTCSAGCSAGFAGTCKGLCSGQCDGSAAAHAYCAGKCEGACEAEATGSCQARCAGFYRGDCNGVCTMK